MVWESPQEQFGDFDSPDLQAKCRLCVDSGVCGNGSSVTMNNEEGQSLVVMWLRSSTVAMQSWLAKLTAGPHMC